MTEICKDHGGGRAAGRQVRRSSRGLNMGEPYPQTYPPGTYPGQPYGGYPGQPYGGGYGGQGIIGGRPHRWADRPPIQCQRPPGGPPVRLRRGAARGENQYRPYFGGQPYAYQGYNGYVRVTAITDVARRSNGRVQTCAVCSIPRAAAKRRRRLRRRRRRRLRRRWLRPCRPQLPVRTSNYDRPKGLQYRPRQLPAGTVSGVRRSGGSPRRRSGRRCCRSGRSHNRRRAAWITSAAPSASSSARPKLAPGSVTVAPSTPLAAT